MAQIMVVPFKVDKNALVKEIERTDKTLQNEKRAQRGQPWLDNGVALYEAAAAIATQIYPGMPLADLMEKLGKNAPQATEKKLPNGQTYQVISLPEADIYLVNDVVQFWTEKEVVYEGAAEKAIDSYKNAAERDKKLLPKVKEGLERVADIYKIRANAFYNTGENMQAADNYLKAYDLQKDPLIGVIDTNSVFNAGYLHVTAHDYDKAIEIFEDAIAHDVWSSGSVAYFLGWSYLEKGEEYYPKAKEVLLKGMELFPTHPNISEALVHYYSKSGDDFSEITDVLETAINNDPSKTALWVGLGHAYLQMGNRAKAIEHFRRFAKAFPNDFTANYYLGDQLMEEGEALLAEAENNESLSKAQKDETTARAMKIFHEAFPVSEKAYENPIDAQSSVAALQRVTRILFRLMDEPEMGPIFEKYNKIYMESLEE